MKIQFKYIGHQKHKLSQLLKQESKESKENTGDKSNMRSSSSHSVLHNNSNSIRLGINQSE